MSTYNLSSDIDFYLLYLFIVKKYAYSGACSVRVHRIFTGTRSVSAKTDLHVIIGGRFYIDDRDLYRVTVTLKSPSASRLHGN